MRISDWSSDVCSSDLNRITLRHAIWIGSVICVLIQRHIVETKAVAQGQGRVFRERYAGADLESGCCLLISRVAIIIIQIIEAIEITPEDVPAQRDIAVEQIRFGKAKLDGFGIARVIYVGG